MKRNFLILCFSFFIFHCSFAQDPTPNGGFENWTLMNGQTQYYDPDNWDQLNDVSNFLGALTCVQTTDAHSGSFAAKLITKVLTTGDTANGIITTGRLILTPPYGVDGGILFHQRPDSIYGWIKYKPTPGDSTEIRFDLFDVANNTVGTALLQTAQTDTSYTRFSAPIVYFSASTPDTSRWLISSSNGYNALPGSTLYIDDIGLVYNTGISSLLLNDALSISPVPANEVLNVKNENQLNADLILFDEAGRMVRRFQISKEEESLRVNDLPEGMYLVRLNDSKNNFLASGKILIQH